VYVARLYEFGLIGREVEAIADPRRQKLPESIKDMAEALKLFVASGRKRRE